MMWNILMAIWPFLLTILARVRASLVTHPKKYASVIGLVALVLFGWVVYVTSYYDNSRYWGIPLRMKRDAAGVLSIMENQQNMQQRLSELGPQIEKHRVQVRQMAEQQKYLYNKLFNATITLEEKSRLDYNLINSWGPMANLYLRDFTHTNDAAVDAATYVAALPPDDPRREVMDELAMSLQQEKLSKEDYLKKLGEYRFKKAEEEQQRAQLEAAAEQRRWEAQQKKWEAEQRAFEQNLSQPAQRPRASEMIPYESPKELVPYESKKELKPYIAPQYEDPNEPQPEPAPDVEPLPYIYTEPISYRSSTNVSEADGMLLYDTHKLMSDIQEVQTKMAKTVMLIVDKYEEMDAINTQLQLEAADPTTRIPGAKMPVTHMFVQEKALPYFTEGMPLYRCVLGLLWCDDVGAVKGLTGQKAKALHPVSGKMVDGTLIEIELSDPKAGRATILHVMDPHAM